MAMMPDFGHTRLVAESELLVDMIQSQEIRLMVVRSDDHWDVEQRRFGPRRKYLGTCDLVQATKTNLKIYYLHLIDKELEVL